MLGAKTLRCVEVILRKTQAGHLGPDHRPVGLVEIEQAGALVIPGFLQIAVNKNPGQSCLLAVIQVHRQESDLVDNVDPAKIFVEFDAVE